MSLINEALKKAQKQRADEAATQSGSVPPPGLSGKSTVPPAPPPRPPKAPAAGGDFGDGSASRPDPLIVARASRSNGGAGRLVLIAVVLITVGGTVVWFLRSDDAPEAPQLAAAKVESVPAGLNPLSALETAEPEVPVAAVESPPPVSQETATRFSPAPVAVISAAPAPVVSEPAPAVAFVPPVIQDAVPSEPIQQEHVRDLPARAVAGGLTILTDAEAQTSARVERAPAAANQPSEAVLRFLERSKVTGVRVSATDPKVLMNDRVYRINDMIDRDLQLRVIAIDTRELKFRDPQGYVYTKAF